MKARDRERDTECEGDIQVELILHDVLVKITHVVIKMSGGNNICSRRD